MGEEKKSGWWWPSNSRKAHYICGGAGRSLCCKWGTFGQVTVQEGNDDSPDNCAVCKRRLAAMTPKRTGAA